MTVENIHLLEQFQKSPRQFFRFLDLSSFNYIEISWFFAWILFIICMAMFTGKWFLELFYRGSSERRDSLMKQSKSSAENAKTMIRKIRQQTLKQLNKAKASKDNERLVENQVV